MLELYWCSLKLLLMIHPKGMLCNRQKTTQRAITVTHVRFKVTTCLYLRPNNRARSLSTLMAVSVNKDTIYKIRLVIANVENVERQISHRSYTTEIQRVTCKGSTMIPTQRSVVVRLRSKSLEGG